MSRPSDREFALKRKVSDLEARNKILEMEVARLKKQLEKTAEPETKSGKRKAPSKKECPDCGAEVKQTSLAHGVLELCAAACGYRTVRSKHEVK